MVKTVGISFIFIGVSGDVGNESATTALPWRSFAWANSPAASHMYFVKPNPTSIPTTLCLLSIRLPFSETIFAKGGAHVLSLKTVIEGVMPHRYSPVGPKIALTGEKKFSQSGAISL